MGRLRRFSGEELCRLLEAHGFVRLRQRGSHVILQRRTVERTVTLPVPMHRELKVGTLLSIVRQSGLLRSLFESSG